MYFAQKFVCK